MSTNRRYRLMLVTEGPVHIGDGGAYGKKDYFLDRGKVSILDVPAFVAKLNPEQLDSYCEFLEKKDSRSGLQDYLNKNKALAGIAQRAVLYRLDSPLAQARRGSLQHFDIMSFIKDAHGCPYVPGSSIKGMLRIAVLINLIARDRQAYERLYDRGTILEQMKRGADTVIQHKALRTLRLDYDGDNAVNDVLRYLSVADSDPLSTDDLIVAKRYDKFSKKDDGSHKKNLGHMSDKAYYQGNELNIYRECLRPGTTIKTVLTIDERMDQYLGNLRLDRNGLLEALRLSHELYQGCFLSHFDIDGDAAQEKASTSSDGMCRYIMQSGPLAGQPCRNRAIGDTGYCHTHQAYAAAGTAGGDPAKNVICYLGGGVDFTTKTVEHALFADDARRVDEVSHILYEQFPTKLDERRHAALKTEVQRAGFSPESMHSKYKRNGRLKKAKDDHRHWRDKEFGVSPHTVKMGKVGDKTYLMGACRVRIEELT